MFVAKSMVYWSTTDMPGIPPKPGLGTQVTLDSKQLLSNTAYTVTTTSYALLAYMQSSQSSDDMDSIQQFLQQQRMNIGGWTSTYVCSTLSLHYECNLH